MQGPGSWHYGSCQSQGSGLGGTRSCKITRMPGEVDNDDISNTREVILKSIYY